MKAVSGNVGTLARNLEAVFGGCMPAASSEGDLLRRFVVDGDEGAFAAIVERHGPMVLGVCRRILGPGADSDDAFQATFLVLLRRARSVESLPELAPWLHGVAWRVAARARAGKARRRIEEAKAARGEATGPHPGSSAESAEVRSIVDEEIGRLPEKYRLPVVLCGLEGLSREDAADRLCWRPGVLRGRLQRGRDRLRDRLIRRGLAPTAALAVAEGLETTAPAAVAPELLAAALSAVVRDLAVGAVAKEVTPTAAATLAGAFLRGQLLVRTTVAVTVLAAAGLTVATLSALVLAAGLRTAEPPVVEARPQDVPVSKVRQFEVKVVGPGGKAIPEATVEIQTPELGIRRGKLVGRMLFRSLFTTTTDGQGVLVIDLPPDCKDLQILVKKQGYGQYYAEWRSGEHATVIPEHVAAELDPAWQIGGVVVDPDGKPVVGASLGLSIAIKNPPGRAMPLYRGDTATTDPEGRWRFEDVPRSMDQVGVEVNHPMFRPLRRSLSRAEFERTEGRDPSARLVLERGLIVTGKVTDQAGKPIAEAIVRTRFNNDRREARTAQDGSYRLVGCEPQMARIVVLAKGHATDMKEQQLADGMSPVDFTMKPAAGLKVKVLDAAGKPVPKARIFFQRWRGPFRYFEFDGVNQYADDNGDWSWDEAPLDDLVADICPPGGTQLPEQPIPAHDAARVVTFRLPPTLVIAGQVVDAETKEPIRTFRVVPGGRWDANNQLSWSDQESFPASDGRFEYRPSRPDSVTLVRVEADGYASLVSRDVRRDEGDVSLRLELRRARGLVGKVLTPKNQAAAGASLAVGVEGTQVVVGNGEFESNTDCRRATADDLGRFSLPAQAGDFQLVILHPEGYAWIDSPATWETVRLIRLEPWARIEGTFRIGTKPAAHVPISVRVVPNRPGPAGKGGPRILNWNHEAVSGPDGGFAFDRVLPGKGIIGRDITFMVDQGATEVTSSCKIRVDLPGGRTTKVDLGGSGRAIVGRLELPDGVGEKVPWSFANIDGGREAADSDGFPRLTVTVAPDGRFRIDDVPPGRYRLVARFGSYEVTRRQGLEGFTCTRAVDVPAADRGPANTPVDLGVMKMEKK
ncbi:sigma-70 family RNA polymerase sigma factor [Aquisphaera insulae]|uniref:sigma-70 family RNA polymerase sigma factor n=1 Tax=Aquisphaera insulae TaxID=2712864 RepID=UPI0013EA2FE0|nr:sigma-70 family RNA polymerase sigma factor [Aquisphaera insulae]